MKSFLLLLFFGRPKPGIKLNPPSIRTLEAPNKPTENQWYKELRVSSRYGTKGSYYQYR